MNFYVFNIINYQSNTIVLSVFKYLSYIMALYG